MVKPTGKEKNTNRKKRSILGLLSTAGRYIKRKVMSIYNKLMKKEQSKTDNSANNVEKLQNKSIVKLKKEDLITSPLKLESSNAKLNYMKHLNNTNSN